jgi:hypothetical protein
MGWENGRMFYKKSRSKWISVILLTLFIMVGLVSNAFAKQGDFYLEGFVGIGTGADDEEIDFGTEIGGGVGFGYEVVDNLQLRADISYYKWSEDAVVLGQNANEELRNIPVFLGGRYLFPITPNFKLFGELGLSVNFLKIKASAYGPMIWFSASESETKLGGVPGVGGYFMMTPQLGLGIGLRYHFIDKGIGDVDSVRSRFFSAEALITYQF